MCIRDRYKGVVKSLTSYGAFVDVGGVRGQALDNALILLADLNIGQMCIRDRHNTDEGGAGHEHVLRGGGGVFLEPFVQLGLGGLGFTLHRYIGGVH